MYVAGFDYSPDYEGPIGDRVLGELMTKDVVYVDDVLRATGESTK